MPKKSALIERTTEAIAYAKVSAICPFCNSRAASNENVEKVVKEPRIPTVRKALTSCDHENLTI